MSWLSREYGVDGVPYFYYTGLFTSAGSLAVFAGGMHWLEFSRCPEVWKKRLNLVSGLAFGVYLVHPVMLLAAEKLMTRFAAGGLVYAGLLAAVVAASWGFALAASRIPFLGRWLV